MAGTERKIGFIGLGRMGRGMAANILRAGAELIVYDPVDEAMQALSRQGARAAGSVAEVAREADVVFTSLPGPAEVEAVAMGEGGLLSAMPPGLALFDLSTSSRALALKLEAAFRERGGAMLDAPVSGGPAGAASGDRALGRRRQTGVRPAPRDSEDLLAHAAPRRPDRRGHRDQARAQHARLHDHGGAGRVLFNGRQGGARSAGFLGGASLRRGRQGAAALHADAAVPVSHLRQAGFRAQAGAEGRAAGGGDGRRARGADAAVGTGQGGHGERGGTRDGRRGLPRLPRATAQARGGQHRG